MAADIIAIIVILKEFITLIFIVLLTFTSIS